jgi:quinol monooxygenase YgiN
MPCGERKSNGSGPFISLTIDARKSEKASTLILDDPPTARLEQDCGKVTRRQRGALVDAQEESCPRGYRRFRRTELAVVQRNSTTVEGVSFSMATTSLGIHYYIKDRHRDTVLSKLKGVIDLYAKEPEFISAIISESPERPNQFALQELWRGTRADFDAVPGIKPYRKAYLADVKQYLEKVNVKWNTPIAKWGSRLSGLNGA